MVVNALVAEDHRMLLSLGTWLWFGLPFEIVPLRQSLPEAPGVLIVATPDRSQVWVPRHIEDTPCLHCVLPQVAGALGPERPYLHFRRIANQREATHLALRLRHIYLGRQ